MIKTKSNLDILTDDNMYFDKNDIENNIEILRSELQKYINDFVVNNATKLYNYIFDMQDQELKSIIDSMDIVINKDNYYIDYINTLENLIYIIDDIVINK